MLENVKLSKEYFCFLCDAVIRVTEGQESWSVIAKDYLDRFGESIEEEAIRIQAKDAATNSYEEYVNSHMSRPNRNVVREEHTEDEHASCSEYSENSDGSISAMQTVAYTKEVFGDKDKLLTYLGFNPKEWQFRQNGLKYKLYDARVKGKQEPITMASVQFRIEPRESASITIEEYAEEAARVMNEMIKPCSYTPKKANLDFDDDMLILMPSIEAHLGKLAHRVETGHDYDYKICSERFRECFQRMIELQQGVKASTALVVIGGDFFNSEANGTTTNGTPQFSTDTRFIKMFGIGESLYCEAIMKLREHFKRIQVMLCPGNHAGNAEFCLYKSLMAYFRNEKDVEFIDNYRYTQSYVFGNTSLFFNHGDPNNKRLLHSIAAEFPKEWGATKYRYLFVGHLHKLEVVDSECGIQMHRVPAICDADAWHYRERFGIGTAPSHEIFAIHKNRGIHLSQQITFGKEY